MFGDDRVCGDGSLQDFGRIPSSRDHLKAANARVCSIRAFPRAASIDHKNT